MPLFYIKGVDTKSQAYIKSIQTHPDIVHVIPLFKHTHTSIAQQHNLIPNEVAGMSLIKLTLLLFIELDLTVVVAGSKICKATCHYLAANDSPPDHYHQWTIRLSLLKED